MPEEILNIEYHHKRMSFIALNLSKTVPEAANKLGITERTLFTWIKKFNFYKDVKSGRYLMRETKIRVK